MTFAEQLKSARFRVHACFTQEAAAAVLEISRRTYSDWEQGNVTPHRYIQEGALRDLAEMAKLFRDSGANKIDLRNSK